MVLEEAGGFSTGKETLRKGFYFGIDFLRFAMSLHKECVIEKGNHRDIEETEEIILKLNEAY